jgi:hypothetical protein
MPYQPWNIIRLHTRIHYVRHVDPFQALDTNIGQLPRIWEEQ